MWGGSPALQNEFPAGLLPSLFVPLCGYFPLFVALHSLAPEVTAPAEAGLSLDLEEGVIPDIRLGFGEIKGRLGHGNEHRVCSALDSHLQMVITLGVHCYQLGRLTLCIDQ